MKRIDYNFLNKHRTLCWECEWAAGKGEKCPWATKFEPVPGWKAIPTNVLVQNGKCTDSFDVYECPLFELMTEIKQGLVKNAGRVRSTKAQAEESFNAVIHLRFVEGKTIEEIADLLDYNEITIYRMLRKYREMKR